MPLDRRRRGQSEGASPAPRQGWLPYRHAGQARLPGAVGPPRPADSRLPAAGQARPGLDGHRLQVASALQRAHSRQLIHRDIKPANIVLTTEKVAKLADLGMARETDNAALARAEKGMTIGTPFYMAPEQIHGHEDVDSRADMYSL